jgi:hypothetical protein
MLFIINCSTGFLILERKKPSATDFRAIVGKHACTYYSGAYGFLRVYPYSLNSVNGLEYVKMYYCTNVSLR